MNESFVDLWRLDDAVGRTVEFNKTSYAIQGVVGDTTYIGLKDGIRPAVYLPLLRETPGIYKVTYELRTAVEPLSLAASVRDVVHMVDPRVAVSSVETQQERIDRTISQEIALARLGGLFAIVSLLMACIGLYGTMTYNVATRTSEFGIRMALGARRSQVLWNVLRQVMSITLAGLAVGAVAATAASRLVQSFLWQLEPTDPFVLAFSILVLGLAASLAGMLPAWRAARTDPAEALRSE